MIHPGIYAMEPEALAFLEHSVSITISHTNAYLDLVRIFPTFNTITTENLMKQSEWNTFTARLLSQYHIESYRIIQIHFIFSRNLIWILELLWRANNKL